MYRIEYSKDVDKTLRKWKKSNPVLFDKTRKVLVDIMQHPRSGIGHPEPMVGGGNITYSRRITANERIIYDVYDQIIAVLVVQVGNHYNDK